MLFFHLVRGFQKHPKVSTYKIASCLSQKKAPHHFAKLGHTLATVTYKGDSGNHCRRGVGQLPRHCRARQLPEATFILFRLAVHFLLFNGKDDISRPSTRLRTISEWLIVPI